jgi:tetratricopeptide (TPR) repeat protein
MQHAGAMVALLPDSAGLSHELTRAYLAAGDRDRAMANCREIIQRVSNNPKVHAWAYENLGDLLAGNGQVDEAIACFKKVMELDPENRTANPKLAALQAAPPPKAEQDKK